MVADCLPVVFTSLGGDIVGIAHAGWRGLADGVLSSTVIALGAGSMLAWMGPAIGPCHYTWGRMSELGFHQPQGLQRAARVSSRWTFMRLQTNSCSVWVLKSSAADCAPIVIHRDFFLIDAMV